MMKIQLKTALLATAIFGASLQNSTAMLSEAESTYTTSSTTYRKFDEKGSPFTEIANYTDSEIKCSFLYTYRKGQDIKSGGLDNFPLPPKTARFFKLDEAEGFTLISVFIDNGAVSYDVEKPNLRLDVKPVWHISVEDDIKQHGIGGKNLHLLYKK